MPGTGLERKRTRLHLPNASATVSSKARESLKRLRLLANDIERESFLKAQNVFGKFNIAHGHD